MCFVYSAKFLINVEEAWSLWRQTNTRAANSFVFIQKWLIMPHQWETQRIYKWFGGYSCYSLTSNLMSQNKKFYSTHINPLRCTDLANFFSSSNFNTRSHLCTMKWTMRENLSTDKVHYEYTTRRRCWKHCRHDRKFFFHVTTSYTIALLSHWWQTKNELIELWREWRDFEKANFWMHFQKISCLKSTDGRWMTKGLEGISTFGIKTLSLKAWYVL